MKIFTAIDIKDGRAVRLLRGDYGRQTDYGDPVEAAARFAAMGVKHLHIVDLDGAKDGRPTNTELIKRVVAAFGGFCEVGGGIRGMQTALDYIEAGVSRVILGTAALKDPAFLAEAVKRLGRRLAVGVDARDGLVAAEGWLETAGTDSYEFCESMAKAGVKTVIYTDISRDGTLGGSNIEAYRKLCGIDGLEVVASGGVSGLDELRLLAAAGCEAAIIGKAVYTGAIDPIEAMKAAGETL